MRKTIAMMFIVLAVLFLVGCPEVAPIPEPEPEPDPVCTMFITNYTEHLIELFIYGYSQGYVDPWAWREISDIPAGVVPFYGEGPGGHHWGPATFTIAENTTFYLNLWP